MVFNRGRKYDTLRISTEVVTKLNNALELLEKNFEVTILSILEDIVKKMDSRQKWEISKKTKHGVHVREINQWSMYMK